MNTDNAEIVFDEHLKLYILLKDKIKFESLLHEHEIPYYFDAEQIANENMFRYLILESDKEKVDVILKENQVYIHTENLPVMDYKDQQKTTLLFIKVAAIVIAITLFLMLLNAYL